MMIESCMPVIPSKDIEKSLRFWVAGLGFRASRKMRIKGKLVGCMVTQGDLFFWLNRRAGSPVKPRTYQGIRLYWAPSDIHNLQRRLRNLGYAVSDLEVRDYGQTEFSLIDDDGYSHCFGVPTEA